MIFCTSKHINIVEGRGIHYYNFTYTKIIYQSQLHANKEQDKAWKILLSNLYSNDFLKQFKTTVL